MATTAYEFKQKHPFERRKNVSAQLLEKFQQRVPIIVEASKEAQKNGSEIMSKKFVTPSETRVNEFLAIVRKHLKMDPARGLYLFVHDDTCPSPLQLMGELYQRYKDEDGFLYIRYAFENTFGATN